MSKLCKICGIVFEIEKFRFRKDQNRYNPMCLDCENCIERVARNKKYPTHCISCGLSKNIFEFKDARKSKYFGFCLECKEIYKTKEEEYKRELKHIEKYGENCVSCGLKTHINDFKKTTKNIGFCKECRKLKKWYDEKMYQTNPNVKLRQSNWAKQNNKKPEKIKQQKIRIKKRAEKIQNTPLLKIRKLVSGSINKKLKNIGKNKGGKSCLPHLAYSIIELKQHLEKLFEPWMNWSNHGIYNAKTHDINPTWNIDHIIPHSEFKYDSMEHPDFQKCWALSNLRPLDAKQNNIDGTKRLRHTRR